jgi:2'-5' RNA ligase
MYLLAIMPPPEIAAEIRSIQEQFAGKYNCKAALKNPVHVTIIPPLWASESEKQQMLTETNSLLSQLNAFPLNLNGFSSFKRNQVIFIDVDVDERLQRLQKAVEDVYVSLFPENKKMGSTRPFHPHFTIGYRDIPKSQFKSAEAEYLNKEFQASFLLDKIFLWKHDGKRWNVHAEHPLKSLGS